MCAQPGESPSGGSEAGHTITCAGYVEVGLGVAVVGDGVGDVGVGDGVGDGEVVVGTADGLGDGVGVGVGEAVWEWCGRGVAVCP
jgi:hypothetical protein